MSDSAEARLPPPALTRRPPGPNVRASAAPGQALIQSSGARERRAAFSRFLRASACLRLRLTEGFS
jgi:hypothetical protein